MSDCKVCHHSEDEHTRSLVSKRHGFSTRKACATCHCVRHESTDPEGGA